MMHPYGSKRSYDTDPRMKAGRALENRIGDEIAEEQFLAVLDAGWSSEDDHLDSAYNDVDCGMVATGAELEELASLGATRGDIDDFFVCRSRAYLGIGPATFQILGATFGAEPKR